MTDRFVYKFGETCRITNLSRWQLDYIVRSDLVRPSMQANPGRGRSRLFTFSDLVLLKCLQKILDAGIPVRRLKNAIQNNKRLLNNLGNPKSVFRYLATDGIDIFLYQENATLFHLSSGDGRQLAFNFVIDIIDAQETVTKTMIAQGIS